MTKGRFQDVEDLLREVVGRGDLAGVVAGVWHKGDLLQINTLGYRDVESRRPMERDSIFCIASMTKPITCCAALLLVEQRKLGLQDSITKWAPEFENMYVVDSTSAPVWKSHRAARDITLLDLLTHCSGLSYEFLIDGPLADAYRVTLGDSSNKAVEANAWMKALGGLPLAFEPGTRFSYGFSTDVVGVLVERASGQSFREFVRGRILEPLGMVDTDFFVPSEKADRVAGLYCRSKDDGPLVQLPHVVSHECPTFCSGGSGLAATFDDYLRFCRMLLGGGQLDHDRILSEQSIAMMRKNYLTDDQRRIPFMGMRNWWVSQGFGMTVYVVTDADKHRQIGAGLAGSFGWPGAFSTWWQVDPAADVILMFMAQHVAQVSLTDGSMDQAVPGEKIGLPEFQRRSYAALQ